MRLLLKRLDLFLIEPTAYLGIIGGWFQCCSHLLHPRRLPPPLVILAVSERNVRIPLGFDL